MNRRPVPYALLAGTLLAMLLPAANTQADDDPIPGTYMFAPEAPELLPLDPERGESFYVRKKRSGRSDSRTWVQEHLRPDKGGIRYREEFELRGKALDFRASGPVVKGSPGLRMELRGLRFHRYPVRIRAIGATNRQGLEIEFRF